MTAAIPGLMIQLFLVAKSTLTNEIPCGHKQSSNIEHKVVVDSPSICGSNLRKDRAGKTLAVGSPLESRHYGGCWKGFDHNDSPLKFPLLEYHYRKKRSWGKSVKTLSEFHGSLFPFPDLKKYSRKPQQVLGPKGPPSIRNSEWLRRNVLLLYRNNNEDKQLMTWCKESSTFYASHTG